MSGAYQLIPWIAAFVMFGAFTIEALVSYFVLKHDHYTVVDTFVSIAITIGYVGARVVAGVFIAWVLLAVYELTPLRWSMAWWQWPLAFVLNDFFYYWSHRIGHEAPILWACHAVHHNSTKLNLSTGLRNSWVGMLIDWIFFVPVVALGVHPLAVGVVAAIESGWDFLSHTQYVGRIPWFDAWANSPSNHRVHHARDAKYIDKNYGGALIIWDRLFGTYAREPEGGPGPWGVVDMPARPNNPFYLEFYVFGRRWKAWRSKHVAEVKVDTAALAAAPVVEGAERGQVPADA